MMLFAPMVLAAIETTVNRILARDPAASGRLARLADKRVVLRLEKPQLILLIIIQPDGLSLVRLDDVQEEDADAIVELSIDTLCELAAGVSTERLMFDGHLAIRGDIHLLEQLRTLLVDVDVDWEGALAQPLGKAPAHALALGIRRFGAFGIRSTQQLKADLHEYTFEEGRLLAGRDQLALAREQLTLLEISMDRLEARFERIKRYLEPKAQSGGNECSNSGD